MNETTQEDAAGWTPPDENDVFKKDIRDAERRGRNQGIKLAAILYHQAAESQLRALGIGVDGPCGTDLNPGSHDYVNTGDPCWCGSDNCVVCTRCGDESHD